MASPSATKYPYPSSEIDVWNFVHDSLTGLTGNNYQQWRQQMHNLIEEQGLVGFINGTIEAPPEKDSDSENYRSWKRSDDLLQKWIRTTLTEGIPEEVKYFKTAKGLWEKLEKLFGRPIISTSSMASSSSSSNIVEKFVKKSLSVSENNYSEWRQQMYNLIKSEGLVGLVSGTVETPAKRVTIAVSDAAGCGGGGGGGGDKGVKEIENEGYSSWKGSDARLQAWIRSTLSKDISEQVVQSRTAKEIWTKLEEIFGHYVPLHKAAIEGNWETANEFIKREPDIAIRAGITEESETMLIVAVKSKRRNNFVKNLVEHMLPEDLALGDTRKRTALHRAAGAGNIEAAELLVRKNPYLPNAQNYNKRIPLFYAASRGDRDMCLYLLRVTTINDDDETKPKSTSSHLSQFLSGSLTSANHLLPYSQIPKLMEDGKKKGIDDLWWNPTPFDGEPGFRILHQLIISGLYDIALALLRDKPELAFFIPKEKDALDNHSLMAIAQKSSSFQSGASFNFFQNKIYSCVPLKLENITEHKRNPDIENAANGCIYGVYNVKKRFNAIFWEVIENFVPCIKHIREKKKEHHDAHELVKFICDEIVKSNYSSAEEIFRPPLFQAISAGIPEIVKAILGSYPNAIHLRNKEKQSIFHHAVVCRCELVFNLIYQVEESKTIFLSQRDKSKNNALHLAGDLAPQQQLYRRGGAALQMQRELQWFKEVEKHVVPRNKEDRNDNGMTPAEVFTDKHKALVKEGEEWMKDRANACSIVAALIATVVFAAAITVPGGSNGNGGPIFSKRASFLIFGIFDAFALFSSMTSVLSFLSILTSRYAEGDFLVTLPRRLIFGLVTLFLSILSTMIAFGAILYLVFEESYKAWIIIPVFVLPGIPVCLFAFWQSPLLLDMFKSTCCGIFLKQSDDMLY